MLKPNRFTSLEIQNQRFQTQIFNENNNDKINQKAPFDG